MKGIRLSGYPLLRCSAHCIQLAIQDSFSDCSNVSELVKKCQRIVQFFKKSGPGMTVLRKAQAQLNMKELSLLQNVKTRWNSEFYMIYRVFELKEPLILALSKLTNVTALTAEDWQMLEELIDLLAPVESATRILCGQKYSTVSMIIPIIKGLLSYLTTMQLNSQGVFKFRACLVKYLNERFKSIESTEILMIATMLDPRFKKGN